MKSSNLITALTLIGTAACAPMVLGQSTTGPEPLGGVSYFQDGEIYQSSWFGRYKWDEELAFYLPEMSLVDSDYYGQLFFMGNWAWHFASQDWLYMTESLGGFVLSGTKGWMYFSEVLSNNDSLVFWNYDDGAWEQRARRSAMPYPLAGSYGVPHGLRVAHATAAMSANPYTETEFDFDADLATAKTIGQVTALMPEASTAGDNEAYIQDGQSGDTDFAFLSAMKPLATIGEYDAVTGYPLTGYPDGDAAWLADNETVRVVYQSESYATMSWETYPQEMRTGVKFSGSKIHYIDYDRAKFAEFLNNETAAAEMVKGSGFLFDTVFNQFGDEVMPRSEGGVWGNQARPDQSLIEFKADMRLTQADFFFNSFCGAYYVNAEKWGQGIGFEDPIWFCAEEWQIGSMFDGGKATALETVGLASIAVDIENKIAYTVPAIGQTGYEKPTPINPMHSDYVVIVLSGYNYDENVAPLKIYVGIKGLDAAGNPVGESAPERDKFLARNGLLYGQIYGMAVENSVLTGALQVPTLDATQMMMEAYLTNPDAAETFAARFYPTSYRWMGWDQTVAVKDTEIFLWETETPAEGYTYFNGHYKNEHAACDPDITKSRYIQNMTTAGAMLAIDFTAMAAELGAANGGLPAYLSANVRRTLAAFDGALTLEVGDKGLKHDGSGTHAADEDGYFRASSNDGLMWVKAADADVLIVDEDDGNKNGERKYAIVIDPETLAMKEAGKGYFLAMAGGGLNPRGAAKASAYGGTAGRYFGGGATSSEFSGTWNVTALVAKKQDNSFYTMEELAGTGEQAVNQSVNLNDSVLIGVLQKSDESLGAVNAFRCDQGGQILMFSLDLPIAQ